MQDSLASELPILVHTQALVVISLSLSKTPAAEIEACACPDWVSLAGNISGARRTLHCHQIPAAALLPLLAAALPTPYSRMS